MLRRFEQPGGSRRDQNFRGGDKGTIRRQLPQGADSDDLGLQLAPTSLGILKVRFSKHGCFFAAFGVRYGRTLRVNKREHGFVADHVWIMHDIHVFVLFCEAVATVEVHRFFFYGSSLEEFYCMPHPKPGLE